ncbi:uncharacterized protein LOC115568360 isoform X4 [Sparus aurata]|uniref:uncharacterized protein LOC115568360 isoform X4 n=1 Tax=Sparus aurata TaxID=8175 RepID=UPI0011C1AD08|nr:uncharacterized protein LOC115568360 isoform X4 [Sparus aurata]XP_030251435.1 uncharacterized protein LOC115568360 isoform X4 [Sparus aurata]
MIRTSCSSKEAATHSREGVYNIKSVNVSNPRSHSGSFQRIAIPALFHTSGYQAKKKLPRKLSPLQKTRGVNLLCLSQEDHQPLQYRNRNPRTQCQKQINGLSRIGGIHLKDNVKRIMEKLMSNDLMSQFNMKGGWGKLAFTKLRLFSVITESVLKTPGREEETEAKISEAVAFCLKYAPDRVGGGGRKSQMQQ